MPFIGRDGRTAFLPTSVNTSSSLKVSNEGDLIVDTDTLFVDSSAGKVGIGTASPQKKLHVSGSSDFVVDTDAAGLRFGSHGEYDIALVTGRNTPTGSSRLYIESGDGEALRIASTGKVLVNHTTSKGSGKLEVYTSSQDGIDILGYSSTSTNGGRLTFYRSKSNTIGNLSEVANGDSLGRIDWRGYNDDGEANNLGATIEALVADNVDSSTDMPTNIVFKTSANGSSVPTEKLRITSDGKLILSGTQRTTPFISGDGGMCIEQSYDGNLRALTIRNKDDDAAAATSMCFSLNRSGGDQDFTAGEIKLEKEQAWTTSSATVDGAMVFSTIKNGSMGERLRITSAGEVLIGTEGVDRTIAGQGFNSSAGWSGGVQIERPNPDEDNNSGSPWLALTSWNGASEPYTGGISFNRSNSNIQGTQGAVNVNQQLGNIAFNGSDGTNFIQGAEIFAIPDQTFATNDGPASLVFGTTPDGIDETKPQERLRITSDGLVRVPDDGKFTAGAGDDLQIYHDGTNNIIKSATTALKIQAAGSNTYHVHISARTDKETIICYNNTNTPYVELYYNNSKKLETTSAGVTVTGSLTQTTEYPTIRPTLDLNFAATKTLDRRITFTRDGIGTYTDELGIVRYASNNVPRFDHDPTTGESLGLLIEESRSNSLTYSQPTSSASFGSNATKAYNAATSPNGKTEAFRVTHNGSSGNSNWRVTRAINFNADAMVLSVWAKGEGGNNYFVWSFQNLGGAIVRAGFNLEGDGGTSIVTNGNGGHTLQIEKYPDGWYRCIIIGNTDSSGSTTQFLYTVSAYSEHSSTSGGSVLLWGFQLEVGAFATSYIPTNGSAVTRGADIAKITGTNFTDFHNTTEGTLYGEYKSTSQTAPYLVMLSDGTNNNRTIINTNYDIYQGVVKYNNGTNQAVIDGGTPIANANNKTALAFKKDDFALSLNGGTVATDTSGDVSVNNMMTIGSRHGDDSFANTTINGIKYYNKRLTNAQLQGLTQQ